MNYSKLNELAAKAMGWEWSGRFGWMMNGTPVHSRLDYTWSPSTCADDALVLLEKAAQGKGYSIYMFPEEKKPYDVELEVDKRCTDESTLPLAMTVAALRAFGIPEPEIQSAMKDGI